MKHDDVIEMTGCKPGEWYVANRSGGNYKGKADENGNVVMHRLPDNDDTKH